MGKHSANTDATNPRNTDGYQPKHSNKPGEKTNIINMMESKKNLASKKQER